MAEHPEASRLPIFSHWGITGGRLLRDVPIETVQLVDLEFIQTKCPIADVSPGSDIAKAISLAQATGMLGDVETAGDIGAITGFVHAHDLMCVLLAAIEQAGLTGDMKTDRAAVRHALEHLEQPVSGLIKTYRRPFAPYDVPGSDAHEALGLMDYTLARFDQHGRVVHLPVRSERIATVDAPTDD